jgi:hypothetical protein
MVAAKNRFGALQAGFDIEYSRSSVGFTWEGLASGPALPSLTLAGVTGTSSTRAVSASAPHELEPMDRRPSAVLDPTRLAVLFARGGDDGRIAGVSVLTRIAFVLS